MRGSEATGGDPIAVLGLVEQRHRELADCFARLEKTLRRCHPETMSLSEWTSLRVTYLELFAAGHTRAEAMADYLKRLREVLDEHRDPRRRDPTAV